MVCLFTGSWNVYRITMYVAINFHPSPSFIYTRALKYDTALSAIIWRFHTKVRVSDDWLRQLVYLKKYTPCLSIKWRPNMGMILLHSPCSPYGDLNQNNAFFLVTRSVLNSFVSDSFEKKNRRPCKNFTLSLICRHVLKPRYPVISDQLAFHTKVRVLNDWLRQLVHF